MYLKRPSAVRNEIKINDNLKYCIHHGRNIENVVFFFFHTLCLVELSLNWYFWVCQLEFELAAPDPSSCKIHFCILWWLSVLQPLIQSCLSFPLEEPFLAAGRSASGVRLLWASQPALRNQAGTRIYFDFLLYSSNYTALKRRNVYKFDANLSWSRLPLRSGKPLPRPGRPLNCFPAPRTKDITLHLW